jgi:hypothetical protein
MQSTISLTTDMMLVLGLLVLAAYMFISEVVRVDVAALIILVLLGVLGLVPAETIFNGFASNAVIAIIGVASDDANGFAGHHWRHLDPGRLVTADSDERPDQ